MPKDYTKIEKRGWICVQGTTGLMCYRKNRITDTIHIPDYRGSENEVKLIDAKCGKPKKVGGDRLHTTCKFK